MRRLSAWVTLAGVVLLLAGSGTPLPVLAGLRVADARAQAPPVPYELAGNSADLAALMADVPEVASAAAEVQTLESIWALDAAGAATATELVGIGEASGALAPFTVLAPEIVLPALGIIAGTVVVEQCFTGHCHRMLFGYGGTAPAPSSFGWQIDHVSFVAAGNYYYLRTIGITNWENEFNTVPHEHLGYYAVPTAIPTDETFAIQGFMCAPLARSYCVSQNRAYIGDAYTAMQAASLDSTINAAVNNCYYSGAVSATLGSCLYARESVAGMAARLHPTLADPFTTADRDAGTYNASPNLNQVRTALSSASTTTKDYVNHALDPEDSRYNDPFTAHGTIVLPHCRGLSYAVCVSGVRDAGATGTITHVVLTTATLDPAIGPELVVKGNPHGGDRLATAGAPITIYTNPTAESFPMVMPSCVGMTYDDCVAMLRDQGWLGAAESSLGEQNDARVAPGRVLTQTPAAGTQTYAAVGVGLVLNPERAGSGAPAEGMVEVPRVTTGDTSVTYGAKLLEAGFPVSIRLPTPSINPTASDDCVTPDDSCENNSSESANPCEIEAMGYTTSTGGAATYQWWDNTQISSFVDYSAGVPEQSAVNWSHWMEADGSRPMLPAGTRLTMFVNNYDGALDKSACTPVAGAGGGGGCDSWVQVTPDFSPLQNLEATSHFPFGLVAYVGAFLGPLADGTVITPSFDVPIQFGESFGGAHAFQVSLERGDDFMFYIRTLISVAMWFGAVYYLARALLNIAQPEVEDGYVEASFD